MNDRAPGPSPGRPLAAGFVVAVASLAGVAACAAAPNPIVESFFASPDPVVRETVLPNIERHRKADAEVVVVDELSLIHI